MKDKYSIILFGLAILLVILLTACAPARPSDEAFLGTPVATSVFQAGTQVDSKSDQGIVEVAAAQPDGIDYCLGCHTDKEMLMNTAETDNEVKADSATSGWGTSQAQVEPWEKVLVVLDDYKDDVHSAADCTFCHGGVQAADKESAHQGLIARPSDGGQSVCATCHIHTEKTQTFMNSSLHATLRGFWSALNTRSGSKNGENNPALEEMFGQQCSSCHASCGDCHVSKPQAVGGGLVQGHDFNKTPSMTDNCIACHGSRVGNEYLGNNEGLLGDVHYVQGEMICSDCHIADQMHGNYTKAVNGETVAYQMDKRGRNDQAPQCIDCHPSVVRDNWVYHRVHVEDFSCQVCHSVAYTNCDSCHVEQNEGSGNPTYQVDESYLTFMIGLNPLQNEDRPYKYVTVRHVPVTESSFDSYGKNLLSTFDAKPTWTMAAPHNIQRRTPQTNSCDSCHGHAKYFLTEDKIKPEELNANQDVITDFIPVIRFFNR